MRGFSQVMAPLHDLLNKPDFCWTPECDQTFQKLKQILCSSVTLTQLLVMPQIMRLGITWSRQEKMARKDLWHLGVGSSAKLNVTIHPEKECLAVI